MTLLIKVAINSLTLGLSLLFFLIVNWSCHQPENKSKGVVQILRGQDEMGEGQVISQNKIVVSQIFQKTNEIIVRISALASKMGKIKKIKAHYYIKYLRLTP